MHSSVLSSKGCWRNPSLLPGRAQPAAHSRAVSAVGCWIAPQQQDFLISKSAGIPAVARVRGRGRLSPTAAVAPATERTQCTKDMSKAVTLDDIRSSLIRQEDTIIFNFIERAQFARNDAVYTPDAIPVPGFDRNGKRYSLLQYVLRETEQLHGSIRRYTSPDEAPFYPEDQAPLVLPPISYPAILAPCAESININSDIMQVYLSEVLPGITQPGDDFNYGSAAVLDVMCLQALSKRIHYGKFVAEAKFRAHTEEYTALIKAGDADGIMTLLTDKAVEKKVLERVRLKAATFGQDIVAPSAAASNNGSNGSDAPRLKVSPDVVADIYEKWVMPLTKEVEVQYLLRRLDFGSQQGSGSASSTATSSSSSSGGSAQ